MGPVLITILALGIVPAFLGLVFTLDRRNKRIVAERAGDAASRLGLEFTPKCPPEWIEPYKDFLLFRKGRSPIIANLMEGHASGLPVIVIDYQYTSGRGRSQRDHVQQVAIFLEPPVPLPDFSLKPEGFFDKVAHRLLGRQDIDIETSEDAIRFSSLYELQGDDEAAVIRLFGPSTLAFLVENTGWQAQSLDGRLMVWKSNWRRPTGSRPSEDYDLFLDDVRSIATLLAKAS